jgi:hypothetical protein
MKRYERETWDQVLDSGILNPKFADPVGAVHEDLEFVRCTVRGGSLGQKARSPTERTIVRRVRATNCAVSVDVGPVLFEDVDITNLRTGTLWVLAPLFKHVVLKGKMGTIVLMSHRWRGGSLTRKHEIMQEEAAFDASAAEFYKTVDWALDISEARFRSLDWRLNLPARLVRRDPTTQAIVTRERAIEGAWRKIPLPLSLSIKLDMFAGSGHPDMILAAGPLMAALDYRQQLEGIQDLRAAGIAEPE